MESLRTQLELTADANWGYQLRFLLRFTTMKWQRLMTATLAPLDLTHVQFVLLACALWMNEAHDHPNQVRLAEQAGVDVKMASEVIVRLEKKGLLVRAPDSNDARAKVIGVTPRRSTHGRACCRRGRSGRHCILPPCQRKLARENPLNTFNNLTRSSTHPGFSQTSRSAHNMNPTCTNGTLGGVGHVTI